MRSNRTASGIVQASFKGLVAAAIVAFVGIGPAAQAQQDYSAVQVKTIPLGNGLAMMTGAGGNIGVLYGPEGVLIVDDQYEPMTDKIRAAVKALSPEPIRFVLNTHWHGDHSGGNVNLGKSGSTIIAHERVRARMGSEQFMVYQNATVPASPEVALPDVTYTDGLMMYLNGETITIRHVDPAHTDGDSIVHFKNADVLHLGDTYFGGIYPFIDVGSGGSLDGMIDAAAVALEIAGPRTRIIPGHGPLSSPKDLEAWRDMLVEVRDRVRKLIDAGKDRSEVIAAQPTYKLNARYGRGFLKPDNFVGIVYDSLTGVGKAK